MKVSKLLAGLFVCAASLGAYAQQPIVIKFSHVWLQIRRRARRLKCSPKKPAN